MQSSRTLHDAERINISPSDLVHVLLIKSFIFSNRTKPAGFSSADSFGLLCFLSDSINFSKCVQYASFDTFEKKLRALMELQTATTASISCNNILSELRNVTKLDDLFNVITDVREVFALPASFSQNEMIGPTKICRDSYLGVFLRLFLVRWESLEFENICIVFENLSIFLSDDNDERRGITTTLDARREYRSLPYALGGTTCESSTCKPYSDSNLNSEPIRHFHYAQQSIAQRDSSAAEAHIHNFFDSSDSPNSFDLSSNSGCSSGASDGTANVAQLIQSLNKLDALNGNDLCNGTTNLSSRLPLAMISLASMWILSKSFGMAAGAAEEAMKTAHQRRDHSSVAKSLLLLFHIFHESQGETFSLLKSEELLLRCLYRCNSLNLVKLTAEVAVLLIELRSKGMLCGNSRHDRHTSIDTAVNSSGGSSSDNTTWPLAALWMQLSCALLGKTSLLLNVLPLYNINSLSSLLATQSMQSSATGGGSKTNPMFGGAAAMAARRGSAAAQETLLRDEIILYTEDFADFAVKTGLTAISLWMREDMLFMAELACRRLIVQFSCFMSTELLINVVSKFVCIQTDIIAATALGTFCIPLNRIENKSQCIDAMEQLKRLVNLCDYFNLLCTAATCSPRSISESMLATKLYVLVHLAMCNQQLNKAERLARRYIQLQSTSYVSHSDSNGNGIASHAVTDDSGLKNSILFRPCTVVGSMTELLLRGKMLLAVIADAQQHSEYSTKVLVEVEQAAAMVDLIRTRIEAAAIKHVIIYKRHVCSYSQNCTARGHGSSSDSGDEGYNRNTSSKAALLSLLMEARELGMIKVQSFILSCLNYG